MSLKPARCLLLACGNTLRGDDGLGPWLAAWAEQRFSDLADFRVVSRQQWTPELAEDIAGAESVLFVDCSADSAPGLVKLTPIAPSDEAPGLATHHLGAAQLLSLGLELYNSLPHNAQLLTVGGGSMELSEEFSPAVTAALHSACLLLEETVRRMLAEDQE